MMNPLDYSKAVTDFWSAQGRALLQAQEQVGKALAESMQAAASGKIPNMPSMPDNLSSAAEDMARAAGFVRLRIDNFTAHPVPGRQIAVRFGSCRRQKWPDPALAVWQQPYRRANTSVHARLLKKSGCHRQPCGHQPDSACDPL